MGQCRQCGTLLYKGQTSCPNLHCPASPGYIRPSGPSGKDVPPPRGGTGCMLILGVFLVLPPAFVGVAHIAAWVIAR